MFKKKLSDEDKKYYEEFREVLGYDSPFSLKLTLQLLLHHYLLEKFLLTLSKYSIRRQ
jgi:hypothetical protein